MNAAWIISFITYLCVALVMIGIGMSQLKSKVPVAFYSGEKPFAAEELTDVPMWNRKHGEMWVIYGIVIMFSWAAGFLIGMDSVWCVVPMVGGVIAPVIGMIVYHHKLIGIYKQDAR